jgi:cupin 2 domain-containing protein
MARFLGIDFSGGAPAWRARCARPSVWIATVEAGAGPPRLTDLRPAQKLAGDGAPFDRLVRLLAAGDFDAAGIDAPFALPAAHLPAGGYDELLAQVAALPDAPDRPFARGAAIVALGEAMAAKASAKPLRVAERFWSARRINTRSTMWNGARGGAPFAAACLALLARARRPIWPWQSGPGMLVEVFPAAQLHQWRLPHTGYAAPDQRGQRATILAGLTARLEFDSSQHATMMDCADALDAVLASFGAMAAVRGDYVPLGAEASDGMIAVMAAPPAAAPPDLTDVNLFAALGSPGDDELFTTLLARPGIRIERIVSHGQVTPPDRPYVQDLDEWVVLVSGSARLAIAGKPECTLRPGDHVLIPAGVSHRVTFTDPQRPTIWLAVHLV